MTNTKVPTATKSNTEWAKGFKALVTKFERKVTELETSRTNELGKYVYSMSVATQMTNTEIAKVLDITRDYAGKLIARGSVIAFGIDGDATAELIKQTGNGITLTAINEIVEMEGTKAEKTASLVELGLPTIEAVKRDTSGPKPTATKKDRTVTAKATLAKIAESAKSGKIELAEIAEMFESLLADMKAELYK